MECRPKDVLRISLIQLPVGADKYENLQRADEALAELKPGVHMAILPEMFCCPYEIQRFPQYAETSADDPARRFLADAARKYGICLVGGSIPEQDGEALYNTSFIWSPEGTLWGRHRKLHRFDVDIPGTLTVQESQVVAAGSSGTIFQWGPWRIGVAICYDIRFPELIRAYADAAVDVLLLPAVFNTTTGPAHWRDLLRMRAVDYQMYVVGVSPARNTEGSYQAYGHSLVADPWGEIVVEAGIEPAVLTVELQKARLQQIRRQLPLGAALGRPYTVEQQSP